MPPTNCYCGGGLCDVMLFSIFARMLAAFDIEMHR